MKKRNLFKRAVSWMLIMAMSVPVSLSSSIFVNADTGKLADDFTYLCDLEASESTGGGFIKHKMLIINLI